MKKVSVILPIYNCLKYLDRCMNTLIGQTYSNLQIILVDDGSTDGSGALCDKWESQDKRILVIHKKNGGVSSARNAGLKAASGEYIGFCDPDDFVKRDMFAYLVNLLETNKAEIAICQYMEITDHSFNHEKIVQDKNYIYIMTPSEMEYKLLNTNDCDHFIGSVWNKLFVKEALQNTWFDESTAMGEDLLYCFIILKKVRTIVFGSQIKYFYYMHSTNVTLKEYSDVMFRGIFTLIKIRENGVDHSNKELIDRNIAKQFIVHAMKASKLNDKNSSLFYLKRIKSVADNTQWSIKMISEIRFQVLGIIFVRNISAFRIMIKSYYHLRNIYNQLRKHIK